MTQILQRAKVLLARDVEPTVAGRRKALPHEPCGKCGHRKDEHRGSCWACMHEERVGGDDPSAAPCSRFGRDD